MFRLAFLISSLWAFSVHADLYRWVDPETGSVKFSSYPPPWFGDPAQERRAPKVEVIPERRPGQSSAAEAAGGADGRGVEALEAQRRALLQQFPQVVARGGGPDAMRKYVESYAALSEQLDRLDPARAELRRAELQAAMDRIIKDAGK